MLRHHVHEYRQMALVSGPRQVGKTTVCRQLADVYLTYDDLSDRQKILGSSAQLAALAGLGELSGRPRIIALDEIHKFRNWKNLLKGFFDKYESRARILVTGSSRLSVYRRGSDSLMGRYFLYHMHPFSVAEVLHTDLPGEAVLRRPAPIGAADLAALWQHGGFPEPFTRRDSTFTRRWARLRADQLVRGDLREVSQVHELGQIELLAKLLGDRSGQQLIYSSLAGEIRVSVDTVRRWIDLLASLHLGFVLRPWARDVANSLRKEPKWFLRDWSGVADDGARAETFVGCHLLKAVEGWTDLGLGDFQLFYLRDKAKREVDFLIARDHKPWCLIEVKKAEKQLSPALVHFQSKLKAPHALQAVIDLPYVDADCFKITGEPLVVPATTLLSQLL